MELLNRQYLKSHSLPAEVECGPVDVLPEKVLQFGEGNFLRGFTDWMINRLNREGLFNGSIVAIQPNSKNPLKSEQLNAQDGCYTVLLRGLENGQVKEITEVVTAISRCLNCHQDWKMILDCAANPEIEYVISNTTEAGIIFDENDKFENHPPHTFPGKLTALMYHRWQTFNGASDKGWKIIPCELIDLNGVELKNCVLNYAKIWGLPETFITWVKEHNPFYNTLVDRVVTGYPKDEADEIQTRLGYQDPLMVAGELFHLWVIEASGEITEELPFHKLGLDVLWTEDHTPYKTRKVRILNGTHTACIPVAFQSGLNTVLEMMNDPQMGKYAEQVIYEEIIPSMDYPAEMLNKFGGDVLERFRNPYIKHYLLSILLNSTAKAKARILPSILQYQAKKGELPAKLCFSFAALLWVYRGGTIDGNILHSKRCEESFEFQDNAVALEILNSAWANNGSDTLAFATEALGALEIWGQDLNLIPGLTERVAEELAVIQDGKLRERVQVLVG